jgi:dihydroxyacetone kinase-like protein
MPAASWIDAATIMAWLGEAEREIAAQADHLTRLDAAIGDADHGTNMRRGFDAVGVALAEQADGTVPGQLLNVAGQRLISKVGGAAGPLWGQALRRAGLALGDAVGDKTMLDALKPAAGALREAVEADRPLGAAVAAAAAAARAGAEATIPMLARRGRASYLGDRSIGHQDPGAASATIILVALQHAVDAT